MSTEVMFVAIAGMGTFLLMIHIIGKAETDKGDKSRPCMTCKAARCRLSVLKSATSIGNGVSSGSNLTLPVPTCCC